MKRIYFYGLLMGLLTFVSCEEDRTPVLELKNAAQLQAISPTQFAFTKENATVTFPAIAWEKVDYGVNAAVNYIVTLTNKDSNKSMVLGETGNTKLEFSNSQMNTAMAKVGGYPGQAYNFEISLKSTAYNYTTDEASNVITFTATPYDPKAVDWKFAYIAVGYPDWDYTNAYLLGDLDNTGTYRGYADFDADGKTFAILDGSDVTKVLATGKTTKKGFCEITVGTESVYTQTDPIKWAIIGDATSGGWSADTNLEYDTDTRLWTVITSLLNKEFKFRGNGDWGINYGAVSGKESELTGDLVSGGNNIKVVNEHPYIVTLNLTEAGKYSYSLVETDIEQSSTALNLPGSYQGWAPDSDNIYSITSPARDFKYSGVFYFPAETKFKFLDGKDWSAPAYAVSAESDVVWNEAKTAASFALVSGGVDILIAYANYYRIDVDTKRLTCTFKESGWEVIGSATPGAWDNGTLMDYDHTTKKWSVEITLIDGEMKFRWDASWDINLGGSLTALTQGGDNIAVTAGTYAIVLDPEAKTATMVRK